MKRRTFAVSKTEAWKAANSARKEYFSPSGSLTESASSDAVQHSVQEIFDRTGRFRLTKADIIGLSPKKGASKNNTYFNAISNSPSHSTSKDRYVLGLGGRRNSDFIKYASPSSTVNSSRCVI